MKTKLYSFVAPFFALLRILCGPVFAADAPTPPQAELVSVKKIWSEAAADH